MIETTIFPGDVIRARYYAVQQRTTKRGETIAELATKTGNFIVLDTRTRTPFVHALISLRNKTEQDKHLPCFAYNKDYHVILNLRYRIEVTNIDGIIFSMGDTPEFQEIKKAYNRYSSHHNVRDVGERRKVSNKKKESEYSNGFHMGYAPTTSVRIIMGGSFGKKMIQAIDPIRTRITRITRITRRTRGTRQIRIIPRETDSRRRRSEELTNEPEPCRKPNRVIL